MNTILPIIFISPLPDIPKTDYKLYRLYRISVISLTGYTVYAEVGQITPVVVCGTNPGKTTKLLGIEIP